MSKSSHVSPPPVQANRSPFGDWYVLVGGSLTGLVAFLAFACLIVLWSRSTDNRPQATVATVNKPVATQAPVSRLTSSNSARVNYELPANYEPVLSNDSKPNQVEQTAIAASDRQETIHNGDNEVKENTTVLTDESTANDELVGASASDKEPVSKIELRSKAAKPAIVEKPLPREPESVLPIRRLADDPSRRLPEHELREFLDTNVAELDLRSMRSTMEQLEEAIEAESNVHKKLGSRAKQGYTRAQMNEFHPLLELAKAETGLQGLPLRQMGQCNIDKSVAPVMNQMSTVLRSAQAGFARTDSKGSGQYQFASFLAGRNELRSKDAIPGIIQMLQAEGRVVRLEMINMLNEIQGKEASQALAQRALFDIWGGAREAAISALAERSPHEYRRKLFEGFRYPWPPIADHAADALVALNDQKVVADLVDLLDEPDPAAPYQDEDGQWCLDELVRVNHMRNCALCHAPSFTNTDPIRGLIPVPGQRLPVVYYQSQRGDFVRADITYIKQDFSAMHEVERAAPWPKLQRFDYFIRSRQIDDSEVAKLKSQEQSRNSSYPQRESVLYALRRLTGVDVGETAASWHRYHSEYYALK